MAEWNGAAIHQPLIVRIVIHADHVDEVGTSAEIGMGMPEQHVQGLELCVVIPRGMCPTARRFGHHVDQRVGVDDRDAGHRSADRFDRGHGRPDQLALQGATAAATGRVELPSIPSRPRPIRDLVDRTDEDAAVRLILDQAGRRGSEAREAVDEFGSPDVEIVRIAVVAQIPDHLQPGLPGGAQGRQ